MRFVSLALAGPLLSQVAFHIFYSILVRSVFFLTKFLNFKVNDREWTDYRISIMNLETIISLKDHMRCPSELSPASHKAESRDLPGFPHIWRFPRVSRKGWRGRGWSPL